MVTNILYRLEYLSISLMALFTLLTLFRFHFGLSLRGQIECSVSMVMGLMASPSRFLPFSCFLTSSLLQSQFSTQLSQTLTVLLLYLVFWFTLQQSSNRLSKSKPQLPPMPQPTPFSASNAQPPPLSTPLSVDTAGVSTTLFL